MAAQKHRRKRPARRRVGRVSLYSHHGAWWLYYRESGQPVRRRVAGAEADAERIASQVNAQLASEAPTLFSFDPVGVPELRQRFLDFHESVLRSSVATINRYKAATQHLEDFVSGLGPAVQAHEVRADRFAAFLREREVSPNGHRNTSRRRLRDKGVQFILEVCRSLYGFAGRMRHLPPYADNPFATLRIDRMRVDDAKAVFVFSANTELQFLQAADAWAFPIHLTLAKSGLRPGELAHLLIEDLDLNDGWLQIRNKPELGWQIKTRSERAVPLIPDLCSLLKHLVKGRTAGPVFLRRRFLSGSTAIVIRDRKGMGQLLAERVAAAETAFDRRLSRREHLRVARTVWRDVGALDADDIRNSFLRIAKKVGFTEATCPKSWRHTFATLLQDANVDPLIRQITLGHKVTDRSEGLGMTATYTHTRPETQKSSIERALRLWPQSLQLVSQFAQGGATCSRIRNQ